ncbi:MAG: ATP-binding cassette domain-containing protein [Bacteroidaceae bacterium]|nr:ATP-binding cassette domain-containing protein [Bacteroidaceae bacterium]
MEYFIEAKDVVKRFSGHTALDGVSINVPTGKVFGLLGPNGAGKTTLIRIINHITLPDSGSVTFNGHALTADDMLSIGYLPEERGLYKKMKVGEQAIYLARLKGLNEREAKKRLTYWFEKFGIMPWWNKKLEELSKGMQQKVQFVITILHEPPLLIFDEPFSGFDPVNAELLKQEILALRDKGHTILFSTHNMGSVEEICDHIALIHHSKVVLQGVVDDIKEQNKTNTYRIAIPREQQLGDLCTVLSEEVKGRERRLTVKKPEDKTNSAFISWLAQQVEILSFAELLPSMNDIFIKTVSK